jgi:hypothetical protein
MAAAAAANTATAAAATSLAVISATSDTDIVVKNEIQNVRANFFC